MYGWEYAFKNIVQKIREKEIYAYTWLTIGRGFEYGLANFIPLLTSYIIFMLSDFYSNRLNLTNIFFVIYVLMILRTTFTWFGTGLGLYYELITIF